MEEIIPAFQYDSSRFQAVCINKSEALKNH